jgi:5'-deoxynucleotidase YfbR-like HD superfamily hydrolase
MKRLFKIQKAIKFATKTHEVYQKQKRKGKDIAYITHPLMVGLILAYTGADDDVICAGILHDTIEDSTGEKKVSFDMLRERFGERVANFVLALTETDKTLPWEERKKLAKEHIKDFSNEAVLVKSADILANTRELIEDYEKDGDQVFMRFNAPKEKLLKNYLETITILIEKWPENPLAQELRFVSAEIGRMADVSLISKAPARIIKYEDYDENDILECPICKWKGKPEGNIEYYDDLFDVSCPNCDKMILIVSYPKA